MLRTRGPIIATAVLLTLLFWGPLWLGYGFIGGDLYSYFFPQKTFFADRLHAGEFPLWNNLTGFGYPVLAESQTGAAYPLHLLAYYFLNVNAAYNAEHLLHYVLCFVATWLFARRIGLGVSGSLLAAVVFTYGWFPPRACLEWAIVTGAWLPVALWCVESFVQTRHWRYAIGLSFALGLQLLAGHFHLAFITQMLVVAYGGWRGRKSGVRCQESGDRSQKSEWKAKTESVAPTQHSRFWLLTSVFPPLLLALAAGFSLAAVQLLPAWELKARSSRATVGGEHDPEYGHLPPLYISQLFVPWLWYNPQMIDGDETIRTVAELAAPWHWFGPHHDLEAAVQQSKFGALKTATNKIEAHLYCGLVPFALAACWLFVGCRRGSTTQIPNTIQTPSGGRQSPGSSVASSRVASLPEFGGKPPGDSRPPLGSGIAVEGETWFWIIAGTVALIYATGWLLPIGRHLPGFNFFRGPGRYGIVTTLAIAIFSGRGLDRLLAGRQQLGRRVLITLVFWSTLGDLWLVSRMVTNVVMVSQPAVLARDESPVRKLLLAETSPARLYIPGQNVGNLLGVSCLPVYLGIAPSEYSDPKFAGEGMPKPSADGRPIPAEAGFSRWLRDSGVTHVLSFLPLDEHSWQAQLAWSGVDPMLHRAWGRRPDEPLYLYNLEDAPGRVSVDAQDAGTTVKFPSPREANRFVIKITSNRPAKLLVRELAYPGWQATIDGVDAPSTAHGSFREINLPTGSHDVIWHYRPASVTRGLIISLLTLLTLAMFGHLRYWHRERLDRMLNRIAGLVKTRRGGESRIAK